MKKSAMKYLIRGYKSAGFKFVVVKRYGVVFAIRREGREMWNISWSCCSPNDKFKKTIGKHIAGERMYSGTSLPIRLSESILSNDNFFEDLALLING